jgi:hypothetical protein
MTSAPELRAEIARLTRQRNELNILGWVDIDPDFDWDADLAAQIGDLEGDLYVAEHPDQYADIIPATEKKAA